MPREADSWRIDRKTAELLVRDSYQGFCGVVAVEGSIVWDGSDVGCWLVMGGKFWLILDRVWVFGFEIGLRMPVGGFAVLPRGLGQQERDVSKAFTNTVTI